MVDLTVFNNEGEQTKQEELLLHEILTSNTERYTKTKEDVVNEFVSKYDVAYSPGTVIQRMALGNKLFHSGIAKIGVEEIKKEYFESATQQIMYNLFTKINDAESKIIKPIIPKKERIVMSQDAIDNAKKIVLFSFYSYMFFGVQNLFGLDTNFFGDLVLPYRPDIIIGAMPFYSAQKLERGMSDRILKYRAIGDIFLAHQRGSTDTLRVDMTLFGPYRGWYLLYLLALQQGGESRLKELELTVTGPVPIENITVPKIGKIQYESHMTFPIVTQTAIMLDMYLQTIEWHQEKDRGGHTVIFIHLLFRKHIDPIGVDIFDVEAKKGFLNYGETLTVRRRKEFLYDTIWKCKQIGIEILKFGLFGGTDMVQLDMEAVTSDPYVTDISKLMSGYSFDINNMASIFGKYGMWV